MKKTITIFLSLFIAFVFLFLCIFFVAQQKDFYLLIEDEELYLEFEKIENLLKDSKLKICRSLDELNPNENSTSFFSTLNSVFQRKKNIVGKINLKSIWGLKENIILGKLIPAGTGSKEYKNLSTRIVGVTSAERYAAAMDPTEEFVEETASDEE